MKSITLVHVRTPSGFSLHGTSLQGLGCTCYIHGSWIPLFFEGASVIYLATILPNRKWLSNYTDVLITINKEDYERAKRNFGSTRVEYVPGVGIDNERFAGVAADRPAKRKESGVPEDAFVMLSIGELNRNKNHETVIKAVARLNNPNVLSSMWQRLFGKALENDDR